jgi:hypothetical protein
MTYQIAPRASILRRICAVQFEARGECLRIRCNANKSKIIRIARREEISSPSHSARQRRAARASLFARMW